MSERLPAGPIYVAMSVLGGFLFEMAAVVFAVYLIRDVHLKPFELVLMGTALEATYFLFEIPTGVVADVVSRRASIVIGFVVTGAALVALGYVHTFGPAILTQILWGFGATFTSGADVAWITDEVGEERARVLYLEATQAANVGGLVGIATGVLIATIDLGLPIRLAGVGFAVVGFLLAAVMPEEGFRRPAVGARIHRSLRRQVGESVRTVRTHHILLVIPAIAAMHGFSKEGFDRLADYHFLNDIGLPPFAHLDRVLWFGVIDGGSLLLGVAATEIVRRKVDLEHVHGPARALAAIDGGLVILVVAFAFSGAFWPALVAFWLVAGLRSVREPVFDAWINRGIDPRGPRHDQFGRCPGRRDRPGRGWIPGTDRTGDIGRLRDRDLGSLARLPILPLYRRAIRRGAEGALDPAAAADLGVDDPAE